MEAPKPAPIPMILTLWLRGVPVPVEIATNAETVEQVAALLTGKAEIVSVSNDEGERPFMFLARREDITGAHARVSDEPRGWRLFSPEQVAALAAVIRSATFPTDAAREAAAEIAKELTCAGS